MAQATRTKKTDAATSGYDHRECTLLKHVRSTGNKSLVASAYKFDANDPIGYNPVLNSCATDSLQPETLQQYRTDDTYNVFQRNSLFGGAKDHEKYRRYNNSVDCTYVRKRGIGMT